MRVLVVHPGANYSVADVYNGLVRGLRQCGAMVATVDHSTNLSFYAAAAIHKQGKWVPAFDLEGAAHMAAKHIETACYEFWPDIIVLVSGFWIPPSILGAFRRRPHHVVAWLTESPYQDREQCFLAEAVDTVIINDPTNLNEFRQSNPRTYYQHHSYDPDIHTPHGERRADWECDTAFVGTAFPSRVQFLEAVDWSGINLRVGGNWAVSRRKGRIPGRHGRPSKIARRLVHPVTECLDNREAAALYRSASTAFNLYRKEIAEGGRADGWAMGPREVELAACETWFAREPRGESDVTFPMLPTFTEPGELGDQLRWALTHPTEREAATLAARQAVDGWTFQNTAATLLRLVDGAPTVCV